MVNILLTEKNFTSLNGRKIKGGRNSASPSPWPSPIKGEGIYLPIAPFHNGENLKNKYIASHEESYPFTLYASMGANSLLFLHWCEFAIYYLSHEESLLFTIPPSMGFIPNIPSLDGSLLFIIFPLMGGCSLLSLP